MKIKELKSGAAFKLMFLSAFSFFIILAAIFGAMAVFGANTVSMNGHWVHGLAAIPSALFVAVFISLAFSGFSFFGFLVLRLLRPALVLRSERNDEEPA